MFKHKSKKWIGLLSVLLITALCVLVWILIRQQPEAPKTELPTVEVMPATTENLLLKTSLLGTIAPLPNNDASVTPATPGKLEDLLVLPGQWVQQGQVLATLDSRLLQAQAKQSQAALQSARGEYQKTIHGARPEEIAQARNTVLQNEAALQQAKASFTRAQGLYTEKIVAKKDVEAAQAQFKTAQAQLNSAQEQLRLLQVGARPEDRIISSGQLGQARAAYQASRVQLSYNRITAPISGKVDEIMQGKGATVDTTTPILRILNLSQVQVKAAAQLKSIQQLHSGQSAEVILLQSPTVIRPAKVTYVGNAFDASIDGYPVYLTTPNPGETFKAGMIVQVSILTGEHPHTLVIPKEALIPIPESANQFLVYTVSRNTIQKHTVTVGETEDNMVEILQGLPANSLVVVKGGYGLEEGTKVRVSTTR